MGISQEWVWLIGTLIVLAIIVFAALFFRDQVRACWTHARGWNWKPIGLWAAAIVVVVVVIVGVLSLQDPQARYTAQAHEQHVQEVDATTPKMDFMNSGVVLGWTAFSTRYKGTFPVKLEGHVYTYTDINLSLAQGGSFKVICPGYPTDGTYTALFHTSNTEPVVLEDSGQRFQITGGDNQAGALFVSWKARSPQWTPKAVNLEFEVYPPKGQIRIPTYKLVAPGEKCHWGLLPDPAHFKGNVYIRFANSKGLSFTESDILNKGGAIRTGKGPEKKGDDIVEEFAESLSMPEQVFELETIAKGLERPFMMIGAPHVGEQVRVEVILAVVPRKG